MKNLFMKDMPSLICAFVDAQGFMVGKKFYARELSVCNELVEKSVEVDPELDIENLSDKVKRGLTYQTCFIHGLEVKTSNKTMLNNSNLSTAIYVWWKTLATPDRPYIAIKNVQLEKILEDSGIPYISLDYSDDTPDTLENIYLAAQNDYAWCCPLHTVGDHSCNQNIRCAQLKSKLYWDWIQATVEEDARKEMLLYFTRFANELEFTI